MRTSRSGLPTFNIHLQGERLNSGGQSVKAEFQGQNQRA
jgi:hypothetical protein